MGSLCFAAKMLMYTVTIDNRGISLLAGDIRAGAQKDIIVNCKGWSFSVLLI